MNLGTDLNHQTEEPIVSNMRLISKNQTLKNHKKLELKPLKEAHYLKMSENSANPSFMRILKRTPMSFKNIISKENSYSNNDLVVDSKIHTLANNVQNSNDNSKKINKLNKPGMNDKEKRQRQEYLMKKIYLENQRLKSQQQHSQHRVSEYYQAYNFPDIVHHSERRMTDGQPNR